MFVHYVLILCNPLSSHNALSHTKIEPYFVRLMNRSERNETKLLIFVDLKLDINDDE